jgi:hypothetical protein
MISNRYLCSLVLAHNARSKTSRAYWLHQKHEGNYEELWQLHESNNHEDPDEGTLAPDPEKETDEPCNWDKNTYLIRLIQLADQNTNGDVWNWPLVMGDLGTTWEPWRAYPTEKVGQITGNLEEDLAHLQSLEPWN